MPRDRDQPEAIETPDEPAWPSLWLGVLLVAAACVLPLVLRSAVGVWAGVAAGLVLPLLHFLTLPVSCMEPGGGFLWSLLAMNQLFTLLFWAVRGVGVLFFGWS